MFDVVIIGGGIIGCSVAREVSRFQLKTVLLEKESDLGCGTSKSNSAIIHAGYDPKPGTLKAKLNLEGNSMYSQICRELYIPFRRIGSLVVAFCEEDLPVLQKLYQRGIINGVPGIKIVNRQELRTIEPNITEEAIAALYAETAGIICPFTLTMATAENALENGVEILLNTEVINIEAPEDYHFLIHTGQGTIESRYVVNAAGLYADHINDLVGGEPYSIKPRKGEYCILDKDQGHLVKTVIFPVPTEMGKGIVVAPTIDGNLLIGPNANDFEDKGDTATTAEGLLQVIEGAKRSLVDLLVAKIITSFAGLRAVPDQGDFLLFASQKVKGLIHSAGIESPGLTAAPAIAKMVRKILEHEGLTCKAKTNFNPYRQPVIKFRELTTDEQRCLIQRNAAYGRIICRCEMITEGEILEAIHRPLGARSLDGLKRRVRTGSGRCQGGFCTPRAAEILAQELKISLNQVTKFGGNSMILDGRTKKP